MEHWQVLSLLIKLSNKKGTKGGFYMKTFTFLKKFKVYLKTDDYAIDEEAFDNIEDSINDFWNGEVEYEEPYVFPRLSKKVVIVFVSLIAFIIVMFSFSALKNMIGQQRIFTTAVAEYNEENFGHAKELFLDIDSKNKKYSQAKSYIKKINTILRYYNQAKIFYDKGNYNLAIENLNAIKLISTSYKPALDLEKEARSKYKEQMEKVNEYIKTCKMYIEQGNYREACKVLDSIYGIFPKYELAKTLEVQITEYIQSEYIKAISYYNSHDFYEAKQTNSEILTLRPNFKEAVELNEKLNEYDEALSLMQKAQASFAGKEFEEANKLIEKSIVKNDYIKQQFSEFLEEVAQNNEKLQKIKAYKDRFEISNVLFFDTDTGMNTMFDIKNLTEEEIEFNTYWCSILTDEQEFYPTELSQEEYAVVTRVDDKGQTSEEFETDFFYLMPNQKYRLLFNFENLKSELINGFFCYTDYNSQEQLKIDFARVK